MARTGSLVLYRNDEEAASILVFEDVVFAFTNVDGVRVGEHDVLEPGESGSCVERMLDLASRLDAQGDVTHVTVSGPA